MTQYPTFIHPDAKIAGNVKVEPFASIYGNVEIGEGTWIGPNAVIMDGARIGKNCRIFPGAVVSAIPQDLKYAGEDSIVEIGDSTTIREFCTVNRGTKIRGKTVVGNNVLLMAYVHVAHDCILKDHAILVNNVTLGGEVVVEDWAILSAHSIVHQYVTIGKHVMIQGGSKVGMDVPPYITAGRDPLCYGGLNAIGLKRRNFTSDQINLLQDIYRILFQKGYNTTHALELIESEYPPSSERDEILSFVRNSRRGLIKGYREDKAQE
jgi:UDP-N-acetylglucosamine acyltransferase